MSVVVWSMVGIALWHFTVLLPDKFAGGIIGAFLVALAGAVATGYVLPSPGIPTQNPPGLGEPFSMMPQRHQWGCQRKAAVMFSAIRR